MTAWVRVIAAIFGFLNSITSYFRELRVEEGGRAKERLAAKEAQDAEAEIARKARQAVIDAAARDPDSIMQDDGFKRRN